MSEFSLFWPTGTTGDGASTYTDTQLFAWLRRTFNSDMYADRGPLKGYKGELAVTAGTGKVTVAPGAAYVYGIPYENDAALDVPIPTPTANTRVDRIVLRANWNAKTVRITRIAGTEGVGAPAIVQNPGSIYDVKLAQVSITTGGVITVTDERQFCRFATEVATENIADGAVTAAKIGAGAVGTSALADGAVTAAKISADAAIPVGTVVPYAGSVAPPGWLLCDGSAVSRSTYAALFSVIGTTYGAGDGSTTFNLPNLKGRIPVGRDVAQAEFDTLGKKGGAKTHTLTTAELPVHAHAVGSMTVESTGDHTHTAWSSGDHAHSLYKGENVGFGDFVVIDMIGYNGVRVNAGSGAMVSSGLHDHFIDFGGGHTHSLSGSTASVGSGNAHNNLQPYIVLNYIIKY